MDAKIRLGGMEFYSHHGCYATEQLVGTRFVVDLAYVYDCAELVAGDEVRSGVSYLDVYEFVGGAMSVPSHTIEHVAVRILEGFLRQFSGASWCEVTISKLSPPLGGPVDSASVSMSLSRV